MRQGLHSECTGEALGDSLRLCEDAAQTRAYETDVVVLGAAVAACALAIIALVTVLGILAVRIRRKPPRTAKSPLPTDVSSGSVDRTGDIQ